MSSAATDPHSAPHIPVLLKPLLAGVSPVSGRWLDGTFGAGGYTRGLLDAGADEVIAIDRDPYVFDIAADWIDGYPGRIQTHAGVFSDMHKVAVGLSGVVLDLGVSSMQIDQAERGFSFLNDGPLDMRMSQTGPSAADLVNGAEESTLANILYYFGEERASRRIARAIVKARGDAPITRTVALAELIENCLPRAKPGHSHPATRSFQALRIAVNDEYRELWLGLMAAERALAPGGMLAIVTFHSIEDRMVKKFLKERSGTAGRSNRYAPESANAEPRFDLLSRKAIAPDSDELMQNPRARSAKLRIARRTDAQAGKIDPKSLSMPQVSGLN